MINHALAELEEANREKLGGHDGSNILEILILTVLIWEMQRQNNQIT